MAGKTKFQKRSRKYYKGRRKFGKKAKLFRDVKSFKLQGKTCLIYSTASGGVANVSGTGIGFGIDNLTIANNRASFTGTYVSTLGATFQVSQLNTLFDRYKIHGVKLKFIPQWNMIDIAGQTVKPVIKLVHDYDDANINGSNTVGSIWARQGKTIPLNGKPFSVYLKPKVANALYNGALVSGYSTLRAPYINMSYTSVPHYALKFAVKDWYTTTNSNQNIRMRIEPTYYVTFREQICQGADDTIIALDENGNEIAVENELDQDENLEEDVPCELK